MEEKKYKNIPRLIGDRVKLCVIRTDDAAIEAYTRWINDEHICGWIGRGGCEGNLLDEKKWAEKESYPGAHRYNIVVDDVLIGNCAIERRNSIDRHYEIGMLIGEPEYQGKGYGTEVVRLLLRYAFRCLDANNAMLKVYSNNPRAIACYKKAGLKECGRMHESVFMDGEFHDIIIMEILKKEWVSEQRP